MDHVGAVFDSSSNKKKGYLILKQPVSSKKSKNLSGNLTL